MMINYFAGCTTREQVKERYRRLAMDNHPDRKPPHEREGATRVMQEINRQYAAANDRMTRDEKPNQSEEWYRQEADIAEEIRKAILAIIHLPHIRIEICGLWVWVKGETRPVKEQLKAAGYRFAGKKQMWYFAGVPARGHGESMAYIRMRYGSQVVKDEEAA